MQANLGKFQAIVLGKRGRGDRESFTIHDNTVKCEDSDKLLGVTIDYMLNFHLHISDICKKAARQINVLCRLSLSFFLSLLASLKLEHYTRECEFRNFDKIKNKSKTNFHSVLDSVAPVKEVKLKQRTEPWMNSEILQNIRFRDETLNKFRKTNDPDLYKKYCQLRDLVQRETRISKRDYLTNKIEENVGNSKKLWDQLKKLGNSSKKKESSNVVLEIDGETCFDPKKVANCFNGFFTTVASNLVDKLPSSFNLFHTESSTFQNFYKGKNVKDDEFMLIPVNEDFIYKELCKLNPSKSTGTDNIPARFVKDAASVFKKPIGHIINLSIEKNVVPKDLKNARVVPLFKKK